ncbi:MAG: hypothetical protein AB7E83_08425 [Ramlibacter sp.]
MEILIPAYTEREEKHQADSKLASLQGATVAFVDDNYDASFADELEEELKRTFGALVKRFVKPWGSAPSPKELIEEAARCQVAIVGIAM